MPISPRATTRRKLGSREILAHAGTTIEKAEVLSMRTRQYATTGRMAESIDAAIMGLSLLGMRITANPDRRAVAKEKALVKRNLAGRRVADLIDAPAMTDRAQVLAVRLLMEIFAAAFLSGERQPVSVPGAQVGESVAAIR